MKKYAFLFIILSGCCSQPQIDLALANADQLNQIYQHTADGNEMIIRNSNPSPGALDAYLKAAKIDRDAFSKLYQKHIRHLLSLGTFSAATADELSQMTLDFIKKIKGQ